MVGGSNAMLPLYTDDGFAALVDVAAWRGRVAAREAHFAAAGIRWCQILAPEKLSLDGDAVVRDLAGVAHCVPPGERLVRALEHPADRKSVV